MESGFMYNGAVFTTINNPSSTFDTFLDGINNSGQIVGYYETAPVGPSESQSGTYGFLDDGGVFTTLAFPGAVQTFAFGINDAGEIVGALEGPNGSFGDFLATPVSSPEPSSLALAFGALLGAIGCLTLKKRVRS